MLCIKPCGAPGCRCKAVLEISWSDTHILLLTLEWFFFFFVCCLEAHLEGVLRFLYGATLWKLNLTAAIALWSPAFSPQLCSSASLMSDTHVLFHSVAGLKQENPNPPCSVGQGGSHHPKECAQLWEGTASRSVTVRVETVHDPCFSLARVLCWGQASAWWFSAAARESFLLPLPSQSPQTLPLPRDCCFGTRHWNFHWGMFSCLSTTAISFFLITGVRCWSDWQVTCDQHREELQFLYLFRKLWKGFSSLFFAVFLCLCWFERCTCSEMCLLRDFVVLGFWLLKKSYTAFLVIFFHHQAGQRLRRPPSTAAVLTGILRCCWGWADWCSQNVPALSWTTLGGCSPPCEMQRATVGMSRG